MTKMDPSGSQVPGHVHRSGGARPGAIGVVEDRSLSQELNLPVVGIGASAGGIEALGRFFDAMPVDNGCSFVVVLHLDPELESQLAQVLSAHTAMPVTQVTNGTVLAPDHIYVIAPATDLIVCNGMLHITEPSAKHGHPIDVLFTSLARDQGEKAIAVVLSGTGSNGTEGLRAVRAEGGMSLVQMPESAQFDGMPTSAILAGMADHILAPEAMPDAIIAYLRHGYTSHAGKIDTVSAASQATVTTILDVLRARGGYDFRGYKHSTLGRRIHRRLGLRNIDTLDQYLEELKANPKEVSTLAGDLMISVTGFFRDPDAWRVLGESVIGPIIAEREVGSSIRIWTAACATGEEAYSVAMLVTELAEACGKHFELKVFATDAQDENLRIAREGVYPSAALAAFPAKRINRFFEKQDSTFQVTKELRDMVVFASHNLLRDPPFSRLDLITCRNVLIYLNPDAQQRIISLCHFGLRPGGHLFLGNAETIGRQEELFDTSSKKWRIYRKRGAARPTSVGYPAPQKARGTQMIDKQLISPHETQLPAGELARRALLDRYAPASVLIDEKARVLYFHGTTRDYLEQPAGEPTRDLFMMARDGLAPALRAAIREANKATTSASVDAVLRDGSPGMPITITAVAVPGPPQGANFILISFTRAVPRPNLPPPPNNPSGEVASDREQVLLEELRAVRAELQATIEHQEATNEELKASSEEAISMNEELQSNNEELETSKEELQSFNEELNTVNSQLHYKISELQNTTNDLNNLLAGSETATVFLDENFCVRWFAPASKDLFDLSPSDIGRPIATFAQKFSDEHLLRDAEAVLKKLSTIEAEIRSHSGRWYSRRMLPYRTQDDRIAGVVITFHNITERKRDADAVNDARVYAETIVRTVQHPLLVLNRDLQVQTANTAFRELFAVFDEEPKGRLIFALGTGEWNNPPLRELLEKVLTQGDEIHNFEVQQEFRLTGLRTMLLTASRLPQEGGREELILVAIEDITDRRRAEQHREVLVGELNHRVKNTLAVVQSIATQTLSHASTVAEARGAFGARLLNLAQAHDFLTRENWDGADLVNIITDTVQPHAGGDRFRIEGEHVRLEPSASLAVSMAIHELCTNAAKYGALSTDAGHVDIVWELKGEGNDRRFILRWSETGGAPVNAPTRKGFGSRLIERALAMELGGTVVVEYEHSGVVCTIDAPMR
ncbi:CheR family methyltransferase [Rhizobium rhizophilum]|uniref:Blue-light-activated histidine kinase n=1 Tax=Rhizobium rhizophilum TaxID=1850373 RepID=A0ABY2QZA6_9HYPH|nr:CheR family methyltransferase [Rhizobium rhizophilum]THV16758.1 PAS domain S-box protein [Rhizobium rhizophilum]